MYPDEDGHYDGKVPNLRMKSLFLEKGLTQLYYGHIEGKKHKKQWNENGFAADWSCKKLAGSISVISTPCSAA